MDLQRLFILKPVVYFLVLLAGLLAFRRLGHRPRSVLLLVPLAVGRAVLGIALGFGIVSLSGGIESPSAGDAFNLVGIGLVGFCLWLAAAKLAFRTPTLLQLAAFAAGAEVVSLAMDYVMLTAASRVIH